MAVDYPVYQDHMEFSYEDEYGEEIHEMAIDVPASMAPHDIGSPPICRHIDNSLENGDAKENNGHSSDTNEGNQSIRSELDVHPKQFSSDSDTKRILKNAYEDYWSDNSEIDKAKTIDGGVHRLSDIQGIGATLSAFYGRLLGF